MLNILIALIPVVAWGTWLAPSQNVHFPNQQVKTLYVTAANLIITAIVMAFQGFDQLAAVPAGAFWLIFLGGIIWTISGLFAGRPFAANTAAIASALSAQAARP